MYLYVFVSVLSIALSSNFCFKSYNDTYDIVILALCPEVNEAPCRIEQVQENETMRFVRRL